MALSMTPKLIQIIVFLNIMFVTTRGDNVCATDSFAGCIRLLADGIDWAFDVVHLEDDQFRQLCRFAEQNEFCTGYSGRNDENSFCQVPLELTGILPALRYICAEPNSTNPDYDRHRQCLNAVPRPKCSGMYPQVLTLSAKRVVNQAGSLLNSTYSQSTEFRIYRGICIHLSTTRNILCSDFFLQMRCGSDAAQWHATFQRRLFDISSDSLEYITFRRRDGSQTIIFLANCPRLKDDRAIKACELTNKCLPILNNFAMNVRFGVFTFTDSDLQSFCGMSQEDLETCVSKLVSQCSFTDIFIYNGSLKVQEKLCSDIYKAQYAEHKRCLSRIVTQPDFSVVLTCTDELMEKYEYVSNLPSVEKSVESILCNAAADYLNCLEMRLQVLCKNETAAWQRKMTRFLLVQAFELTFCSSMLGHEDIDESRQGEGEALKVNKLGTALLLAISTAVTCAHYIKCLLSLSNSSL